MIDQLIKVVAAVVLAPIIGGLLMGLDRKITARIQGRIGPPILQPFYDVFKLLYKEPLILNRVKTMYVHLHLAFMVLVVVILVTGQDMLMALFAHAFSTIALVLGGMSVRSPYSRIGSQRKIMQMLAYEPILVLMVVGIALNNYSFRAGDIMLMKKPLIMTLPLVFLSYFAALIIKLEKSPFDVATSHHAHQELVKGLTLEFSGPFLALIEITHFIDVAILFTVVVMFWSTNLWMGAALAAVCFLGQIIVDNAAARIQTMKVVKFMWTLPMILAVGNIVWFYI